MKNKTIKTGIIILLVMTVAGLETHFKTTGTSTMGTNLQIAGNIIPETTDNYSIGTEVYRWGNAFIKNITEVRSLETSGNLDIRFKSTANTFNINSITGRGITFKFTPEGNTSREIMLITYKIASNIPGLVLYTDAGEQYFIPATDNAYELGTWAYAWKNVTAYDFTTKSSGKFSNNYLKKYGKTAVRMLKDIKADANGNLIDSSIPKAYLKKRFWQVKKQKQENGETIEISKTYDNYNQIPDEDKNKAEEHAIISMKKRAETCEQAIREIANELCAKDNTYSFC